MGKRFTIQVGDRTAVVELLEEQAPTVAAKFWESLPLQSFSIHAKFAGGEMIVMVPFYADSENEVLEVQPGDIGYFPGMQTICLFYGDVTPFGYVSVFARVVEGLPEMRAAGQALIDSEVSLPVKLVPLEEVAAPAQAEPEGGLVGLIRGFTRQVWDREPEDVRRLRETVLPPGGRWSGTFFCDVLSLWSGQILLTLRGQLLDGSVAPGAVALVTAAHLRQLADWLAHWRMDDIGTMLRQVADGLARGEASKPAELARVIEELCVAINRVQSWIDGYVPWARLDSLLPPLGPDQAPGGARHG